MSRLSPMGGYRSQLPLSQQGSRLQQAMTIAQRSITLTLALGATGGAVLCVYLLANTRSHRLAFEQKNPEAVAAFRLQQSRDAERKKYEAAIRQLEYDNAVRVKMGRSAIEPPPVPHYLYEPVVIPPIKK